MVLCNHLEVLVPILFLQYFYFSLISFSPVILLPSYTETKFSELSLWIKYRYKLS